MALFTPRVFPEIHATMLSNLLATTPLTDVNFSSVFSGLLEAAAQEDDEQYFQMLEIIRNFSLDSTTGTDLDNKAAEFDLTRIAAGFASSTVTLGDSSITKVSTGIFSGTSGPAAGATSVNGDASTGFTATGSIVVGRTTPNVETVAYSSITANANSVTFNLTGGLAFDHGTDETIILSQGGNRAVSGGTVVVVPESDLNERVEFTTDALATILDGESELLLVPMTASEAGSDANVPIGSIREFDSPPFSTATVSNTARITNGRDEETDQELRDRIKDTIQSLSRGTRLSIIAGVEGVISTVDNKRVVSASLVEPTVPADVVKLFIDDGTGFVPTFTDVGFETAVASATGGESLLTVDNVPIMKAFVETQNSETFSLSGTETLFVDVGGTAETITFASTDFSTPGAATAQEVLEKINSTATLIEARKSSVGTKVRIFSRGNTLEEITVTGGTANTALNFPTDTKFTTKLYRKRGNNISLLNKDGLTASIESGNTVTYNFSTLTSLVVSVDGDTPQNIFIRPADFGDAANVTADQISATLNAEMSGATCASSSNNTKVTIASNIERDSGSKIRILENWSQVWSEESSVLTDRTTEFASAASDVTLFADNSDFVYLGHTDVKFPNVFVKLSTPASVSILPVFEYWNGSTWTALGVLDGTAGFTQDGDILFGIPSDWTKVSVNASALRYWIRIQRTEVTVVTDPIEDRIRICGGNEELGFSETEQLGSNNDYTLNRFLGQLELATPLVAADVVTLGSIETRARMESGNTQNFALSGGELLTLVVDGASLSYSFVGGDFAVPGAATAVEVVNAINTNIASVTASVGVLGTRVVVESNKLNAGTIAATATAANTVLDFPITTQTALISHIPAIESVAEPFVFLENDSIIAIIDGNSANSFTVPNYFSGTLTTATSSTDMNDVTASVGLDSVFPTDADVAGYDFMNTTRRTAVIQDITYTTTDADPVRIEYVAGTAAVAEISTITTVADTAGSLNSTYFLIDSVGTDYYVWFDNGGAGVDPSIGARTGIQVVYTANDTANTIAGLVRPLINAKAEYSVPVPAANVLTVTAASVGSVTDLADGVAPTGFTLAVTQQGTDFAVSIVVAGNDITVGIDNGVSTATEVKTAYDLSAPAVALAVAVITGTAGNAQSLAAFATLVVERKTISTYTAATGRVVLSVGTSFTPQIGDTYQILPTDADEVVSFFNNSNITLLTTKAAIKVSSGGTKVQIESLTTGEDASVQVSGGPGNLVLGFGVSVVQGVDGYRYFNGLAQLVQKTVDGVASDETTYPGIRAAGVQVEVIEPVTKPITVQLVVTATEGVTISSITNEIRSAVSAYINGLTVGADVIQSSITCAVTSVSGVFDAQVTSPTANVAIADNELARVTEADIIVG